MIGPEQLSTSKNLTMKLPINWLINTVALEVRNQEDFGTVKQPVFGILCQKGKVFAKIVSGIEAKNLQLLIEGQVKKGSKENIHLSSILKVPIINIFGPKNWTLPSYMK